MAIQELSKVEIEAVSGGGLLDSVVGLVSGLPLVGGLLGGLLSTVGGLLNSITGIVSGLPVVGPLLGSVLGLLGGLGLGSL